MTRAPPVFRVALGFAAGVALGPAAPAVPHGLLSTSLIAALLVLLWRRPFTPVLGLGVSLLAGSLWGGVGADGRGASCLRGLKGGAQVQVLGYFAESGPGGGASFRVVDGLSEGCRPLLRTYIRGDEPPPEATYGRLSGRWSSPPGGASQGARRVGYLSGGSFKSALGPVPLHVRIRSGLRGRSSAALDAHFGPRAGLAGALTIAEGDGVTPDLREAFVRSGSAHLLSISGFHVGVIGSLLALLATAFGAPPRVRAVCVTAGVWGYVALIGMPTSACRAAWMGTAFLAGTLRGRPTLAFGSLGAAMLMLALVDPSSVGRAGYQLTVAGTAGILILGRWVDRHLHGGDRWAWLRTSVATGVGASVFTAPFLAFHFGELSLLSVPSSLVMTPLVAVAIPGVMAVLLWDVTGLPGAGGLAYGVDGTLIALEWGARALSRIPGASVSVTSFEVVLLAVGGVLPLVFWRAPWRVPAWLRVWFGICSGLALSSSALFARDVALRNRIEVVALDVGQGDAILVRTPRGRWVLVDAGPRQGEFDAGRSRVIPYLRERGVNRLEAVVLTHPDEDHAGGLASVLSAVPTGVVLGPGRTLGQAGHLRALEAAGDQHVPWRRVKKGDRWKIDGVDFEVLHPDGSESEDEPNEWSVVLWVSFGEFDALLTGDVGVAAERRFLDVLPDTVEFFKVGHHGSRTSTSAELLGRIHPRYSVISVGRRNRYGHPAPGVMGRLGRSHTVVLRTDQRGTIEVVGRRDGRARVRGF